MLSAYRLAIYSWSPEEDPQESNNDSLLGDEYSPLSSIGHLQVLFALLQFGKRNSVDPTAFILSLGLDITRQQDAQVSIYKNYKIKMLNLTKSIIDKKYINKKEREQHLPG